MMNLLMVLVIGLVVFIVTIAVVDFYFDKKRKNNNEAIMRIEVVLERYTDHLVKKSMEGLNEWQKSLMNGLNKEDEG